MQQFDSNERDQALEILQECIQGLGNPDESETCNGMFLAKHYVILEKSWCFGHYFLLKLLNVRQSGNGYVLLDGSPLINNNWGGTPLANIKI